MAPNDDPDDMTRFVLHRHDRVQAFLAGLLEQRVMELESFGLVEEAEAPVIPGSVRHFAIISLQENKPAFFVTADDGLLQHRMMLEDRYGVEILSIHEAFLLFRGADGPSN